jgi:hypothetical protein
MNTNHSVDSKLPASILLYSILAGPSNDDVYQKENRSVIDYYLKLLLYQIYSHY